MNVEINETIENLKNYIRNVVFTSSSVYMRNLKTMKFNTDLEWFNCAIIAVNSRQDAYEQVVVNTIYGWDSLLEVQTEDGLTLKNSSIKYVPLLNPHYSLEENYLSFDVLETYYLTDFKPNFKLTYKKKSAVSVVIGEFKNYSKLLDMLKEGWQDKYLKSYLELFEFYYLADETFKDFYLKTLKLVFSEELKIRVDDPVKQFKTTDYELITIYKNIHELITSFHVAYKSYLNALEKVYRELEIQLEMTKVHTATYDRIKSLAENGTLEPERGDIS